MEKAFYSTPTAHLARPRIQAVFDELVQTWDQRALQTLGLVVTVLIAHRIAIIIYNLWFHPLSKFPGPASYAAFYFPFLYHNYVKGDMFKEVVPLHRKYGPIVRVGPNHLTFDGSVGWPTIFGHRAGKPEYSKVKGHYFPNDHRSLIGAPKDLHRKQRRQLAHAFSDAALKDQEVLITKYVDLALQRLTEMSSRGEIVDFVDWYNFTTFDIIGDLTLSQSFDCLDKGYHPWVRTIFDGIRGNASNRFLKCYFGLKGIVDLFAVNDDYKKYARNRALASEMAKERISFGDEAIEGQKDIMTYMLKKNRDGEFGMQKDEIILNTPTLLVAGSETTATALSGWTFYMHRNPQAYKLLTNEIRSAFSSESEINLQSTGKLEYLHACIEETLRVYPPAAETPPRHSPGDTVDGKYVPAGTSVTVYQWATFRNPDNWAEPDSYIPERWLPESHPLYDVKFKNDNRAVFKPFSFGARDCIGKNLAYSELRVIIARLLYRFDIEVQPGQEDWHEKQRAFLVWEKGPLKVKLFNRQHA